MCVSKPPPLSEFWFRRCAALGGAAAAAGGGAKPHLDGKHLDFSLCIHERFYVEEPGLNTDTHTPRLTERPVGFSGTTSPADDGSVPDGLDRDPRPTDCL